MAVTINGTTGIAVPLGSASSPAETNTTSATTGIYYPSSTTLGLSTNGTNAMYIDASQNVGIGTTSPGSNAKLAVVGPANSPSLFLTDSTQSTLYIKHEATNLLTYEVAGSAVQRWVGNSAERMRIDASGNLLVGATSTARSAQFRITGQALLPGIYVGSTTGNCYIYEGSTNVISFRTGASGSDRYFSFDTSGNGNALSGSWVNGSDARLKENVKPLDKGLLDILSLRPVSYNRIGAEQTEIGFIAQEVQPIIPEVVHDTGEYLGISYGNITAVLVKAIQELSAEVEALKAKVGA